MKDKKQEMLKQIFDSFIECVKTRDYETYHKDFNYGKRKNKRVAVLNYVKRYATDKEVCEYENAKDIIATEKNMKSYSTESYRENCMKYKYVQDLLKLLFFNDETLYKYYSEKNIYPRMLEEYLKKYSSNGKINVREKEMLKKRIEEYDVYCKSQYKKAVYDYTGKQSKLFASRVVSETSRLMEDIIKSKHSIKIYSDLNCIDHLDILRRLKRVKNGAPKEYEEFMKIVDANTKKEAKQNATLAIVMNEMIKTGVEEDGYTRPFDIVDYYETTGIGIDAFIKSVKIYIHDEKRFLDLKILLGNSLSQSKQLFYLIEEINSKNTIMVNDEKVVVGLEEKKGFIDYLESKNIPVNLSTYKALERRYIDKLKKVKVKSI